VIIDDSDMRDLLDYAAVLDRRPGHLRLVRGQYADVVLDRSAGVAWRFPTSEQERQRLAAQALRLARVAALKLPVATPQVRAVRAAAPLGEACIELSLIPGTPLSDVQLLSSRRRHRLAEKLGDILRHLPRVDASRMDVDRSDWSADWIDLETRVTVILFHRMSSQGRARARAELRRAIDVARDVPLTFVHGDLGGSNILVDPSRGSVTGIVDWDSACLGDLAVDVAALTGTVDGALGEDIVRSAGVHAEVLLRADAYRATFALQEALFGAEYGNDAALSAGLAGYR
jgi:aminoglycoside phosphotransferase (APT) family kinase protein